MAVVAISYCLAGHLSLLLAVPPGYATAIWPSAGIALAATLLYGSRIWPAIWVGSLAVNLWTSFDGVAAGDLAVIAAVALIAAGASLQAVIAAWLLRRFGVWPHSLQNGKTVTRFLLIGGPVACTVNASIGATSLLMAGLIDSGEFGFNWLNWWVGDAIGVTVITPLALIWSGAMGSFWRRRAATVTVPSSIALAAAIALFLIASNREQSRIQSEFRDTAYNIESAIKTELNIIIATLGGIQSFFASSQSVDADEFRIFSRRALTENPELLALSFNRHVPHAQRAAYEQNADTSLRLRFTERNASGQLIRAQHRDHYTVVQFIEPFASNRTALGLDVGFDPARKDAIQRARNTGHPAATSMLQLVQSDTTEPGLLIFAPIYTTAEIPQTIVKRQNNIVGYAVGVILIKELLETAIAGLRLDHVSLELYDNTDIDNTQLLTTWGIDGNALSLLSSDRSLTFAGREWRVSIGANAEYVALHRAPGLIMILTIGLVLCGLLGAFNLILTGNERREALRASRDVLTGLANRSEFERRLRNALISCKSQHAQHVFAYCDLDRFKIVNDTAGHQAGDDLLKTVAGLLRARLRDRDTIARLGGDEFGLLLEHCPIEKARDIAEKICQDIFNFHFTWNDHTFRIGISIGVVALTATDDDITDIMTRADTACYMAKDRGRNRVHVVRPENAPPRNRKSDLQRVTELQARIKNNELLIYQQPIHALDQLQQKPIAHELLLRIPGTDSQVSPPAGMISLAEKHGIITKIDRWVLRSCLRKHEQLCTDGSRININLSAASLNDASFVDFIHKEFEHSNMAPDRLCFEITESAAIQNLDSTLRTMEQIKRLGCEFALDDFGAGVASFRNLDKLPVSWVKIDGHLIQEVASDPATRAMIQAIQHVADSMGIATIAEWVSDDALLAPLQDIGVGYVQGFAIGRPEPCENLNNDSGEITHPNIAAGVGT
ncbi:MAG: EAL domain-containing protein [Gammaproteobacteria bacterium]|nr:EAL domain-containing protein [Gammaproteobacteria bacterium]